ncbi:12741_t:CDS:2 [Funneliformis mosseae]|uniref:12741_t:CDS:1 n=1 Tax=Funneliformis mosseae TaxID=27381 RepID=A0A9N8YQ59_FUNMO|nr:12741_t:CDS:2 [Funneliformis mosseae]
MLILFTVVFINRRIFGKFFTNSGCQNNNKHQPELLDYWKALGNKFAAYHDPYHKNNSPDLKKIQVRLNNSIIFRALIFFTSHYGDKVQTINTFNHNIYNF